MKKFIIFLLTISLLLSSLSVSAFADDVANNNSSTEHCNPNSDHPQTDIPME